MKKVLLSLSIVCFAALAMLFAGCDTESASSNDVSINPSSASVKEGESVTFEANGGYDYSWSLSEPTWGTLSSSTGSRTTYTSTYSPATNTTSHQILTVTSTIEGTSTVDDGSSSTNSSTAYAMTSEVYIEHFTESSSSDNAELSISPTSASLSQWASQEFTASGGSGEYSWSVASNEWGVVSSSSGSSVSYTATVDPGDDTYIQTITVTDSDGASTSASITQTD